MNNTASPLLFSVVVAAGMGRRMPSSPCPKQYLKNSQGETVLEISVRKLLPYSEWCVVVHSQDDYYMKQLPHLRGEKIKAVVGGKTRAESVHNGLLYLIKHVRGDTDNIWVLVHDAVRPWVAKTDIERLLSHVKSTGRGAILAKPVTDTIKQLMGQNIRTLRRSELWHAQTPQLFPLQSLYHALCEHPFSEVSDEASAMEKSGYVYDLVSSSSENKKMTYDEDMAYLQDSAKNSALRIGHGFDVHAFCTGNHVMLGGVKIPHNQGIAAHSDGDVILHAVCDALLGAMGCGDIGEYFSNSDEKWQNIASSELVKIIYSMLVEKGFCMINLDVTVIAEKPNITAYKLQMKKHIAQLCYVSSRCVNIKATTTEGLGFIGKKRGIAAQAVVLIQKNEPPKAIR